MAKRASKTRKQPKTPRLTPQRPEIVTGGGNWLSIFAAAAAFIDDSVMEGSLFPQKTGTNTSGLCSRDDEHQHGDKAFFSPITIHDRDLFLHRIAELYDALGKAETKRSQGGKYNIPSTNPKTFMERFRRYGYHSTEFRPKKGTARKFVKKRFFDVTPDADKTMAVYQAIRKIGYKPNHKLDLELVQVKEQGMKRVARSNKVTCRGGPRASPTAVADTGSIAAEQGSAATMAKKKSAVAASIPKLHSRRKSEAATATAATASTFGRVSTNKTIVPTPIAHHAATTALRIATKSIAKPPTTSRMPLSRGSISGTGRATCTHSVISLPPFYMARGYKKKQPSVSEGTVAITPPLLITIQTDEKCPPLPNPTSTIPGMPTAGTAFISWTDTVEVPASAMPQERSDLEVEDDIHSLGLSTDMEEHTDEDSSPIEDGVALDKEGEDLLSVMSTSSPIIIAVTEDDVSSCPSINYDEEEDAFIPFMD